MTVGHSVTFADPRGCHCYLPTTVCGFSMMEQVRHLWPCLALFGHGELAWLFHEPHTGLDDCLNMIQSWFRKRRSAANRAMMRGRERPREVVRVWRQSRCRNREGGHLVEGGSPGGRGRWIDRSIELMESLQSVRRPISTSFPSLGTPELKGPWFDSCKGRRQIGCSQG